MAVVIGRIALVTVGQVVRGWSNHAQMDVKSTEGIEEGIEEGM